MDGYYKVLGCSGMNHLEAQFGRKERKEVYRGKIAINPCDGSKHHIGLFRLWRRYHKHYTMFEYKLNFGCPDAVSYKCDSHSAELRVDIRQRERER